MSEPNTIKQEILMAKKKEPLLSASQLAEKYGFNLNYVRKVFYLQKFGNTKVGKLGRRPKDLNERVFKALKRNRLNVVELANRFNVSPAAIEDAIDYLKSNNRCIDNFSDGTMQMSVPFVEEEVETMIIDTAGSGEQEFIVGFIADTHIGSKYERLDVLNDIYDRYEAAGVETVYHGGNWIDGEKNFNKYDIYVYGVDAQIDNFIEKYPRKPNIKTFIVSGDDHEGWYVQREHVNVGKLMEMKAREAGRDDLFDLGYQEANITYKQEGGIGKIRVIHPGGGSSYAHSYKSQKYVESLQGGEKPSIVLVGHYHKFNYSYPRSVHMVQCGCVQDQTTFMRKRNIEAHVGACIVRFKQNSIGVFTSVNIEWMPYYNKKFYTYKWKKDD